MYAVIVLIFIMMIKTNKKDLILCIQKIVFLSFICKIKMKSSIKHESVKYAHFILIFFKETNILHNFSTNMFKINFYSYCLHFCLKIYF